MSLCLYESMCLCIYVSMYLCMYVCMFVCLYVCMYVCMYVCICIFSTGYLGSVHGYFIPPCGAEGKEEVRVVNRLHTGTNGQYMKSGIMMSR